MSSRSKGTRGVDGGRLAVLDLAGVAASGLDRLDNPEGLLVSNLTEDDVLAIEPRGDDGSDEELGAVGVGAGIGHGEEAGLGVSELEVLILELLAVDRLAASALLRWVSGRFEWDCQERKSFTFPRVKSPP